MVVRHLVFAGLCAAASVAQAGVVEVASAAPSSSAPRAAWSFFSGPGASAPATTSQQLLQAGPGTWSMHSRAGDAGGTSTMLLTNYGAAPAAVDIVDTIGNPGADLPAAVDPALAVPEPATALLLLSGLLGAGFLRRRRH